jgi:hypothetical protein
MQTEMTSRQRVLAALNHEPPDRAPRMSHHAFDHHHGKLFAAGLFGRLRVFDLSAQTDRSEGGPGN